MFDEHVYIFIGEVKCHTLFLKVFLNLCKARDNLFDFFRKKQAGLAQHPGMGDAALNVLEIQTVVV